MTKVDEKNFFLLKLSRHVNHIYLEIFDMRLSDPETCTFGTEFFIWEQWFIFLYKYILFGTNFNNFIFWNIFFRIISCAIYFWCLILVKYTPRNIYSKKYIPINIYSNKYKPRKLYSKKYKTIKNNKTTIQYSAKIIFYQK